MSRKNKGFHKPFEKLASVRKSKSPAERNAPSPAAAASKPSRGKPPESSVHNRDEAEVLFQNAVAGAERLDGGERVAPRPRSGLGPRDDDEAALEELKALVDGRGDFTLWEEEEDVGGYAPDVDPGMFHELKRGRYAWRRHVDLHGYTREQAKETLAAFLRKARVDGERCVLVVTGRGKGSPHGLSVLKESLPLWLSRHPNRAHVMAFCTAKRADGGPGAFYVVLRGLCGEKGVS